MSKVPAIRFEGFTDPWEQRKLGDALIDLYNGQTPSRFREDYWNGTINWLSSGELNRGIVCKSIEKITAAGQKSANLRLIPAGTFVMAITGLEAPGTRGNCAILGFSTTLNQSCMALFPNKEMLTSDFLFQWYSKVGENYGIRFTQGTKQQSYNAETIKELEIVLPPVEEQTIISKLLSNVDNLITLHQRKYSQLSIFKKALLDKMFPRDGATEPEIRFSGFTDPWEQRKLGDVFKEYSEKGHPELPALTIIQGGGTIRRDESDRNLQYDSASLSNYKMVNDGDFIVHLRSFEGGLEKATTLGIISPAYHTFHGEETDSRFYYSYFRSPKFINKDLKPHVYGIRDGRSIDIEGMKTIDIPWTNIAEQKAIGDYIDCLDNLITLHQRKLNLLKSLKAAYLDKMFV